MSSNVFLSGTADESVLATSCPITVVTSLAANSMRFCALRNAKPVMASKMPKNKNTVVGKPGTNPIAATMPAAEIKALGCPSNCLPMSLPKLLSSSTLTRDTIIPEVIAINSAGICATSPSPMVKMAYSCNASLIPMPFCSVPIESPPMIFTRIMINPAMASPLTNFIAPSIEPNKRLSRVRFSRRWRASARVITPARISLSILICLPGMASSENRALTSAIRSEPLVITINCTMVMIKKITKPTIKLPPTTNSPKV